MPQPHPTIGVRLRHSYELDPSALAAIRSLCDTAFDGDFTAVDLSHALGGLHALVSTPDAGLIGHAAVVARAMLVNDQPLRCGYVEAVAVDPAHRRSGIADAMMAAIENVISRAYDFGALSASDAGRGLYARRGWVPWDGTLAVLSPHGRVATPDDDGSVLVRSVDVPLPVAGALVCDWRDGDVW